MLQSKFSVPALRSVLSCIFLVALSLLFVFSNASAQPASISPNHGSAGTVVTISGTNLDTLGGSQLYFGALFTGTPSTSCTVVSSSQATATVPAGLSGAGVEVYYCSYANDRCFTHPVGFNYSTPTVSIINPTSGSTAGGTSVTITGTNLTGATAVTIGGAAATGITVNSATSITATTPAGSAGTASVLVTTLGGTNSANTLYTYVAAPTVTGISPTSGTTAGGTSVTITGTNLTGATAVTIGGAAATGITVNSATSITATTPAGSAGTASVLVTTLGGTNSANTLYTYVAAPTVTGISPTSGTTAGGTSVTITGTN